MMKITLFSFGFKHGHAEADMVVDVRFLPNPYWVSALKEHSGLEAPVAAYVLESAAGREFFDQLDSFLIFMLTKHRQAGRKQFACAIGCTGGRHRSVAVTEHLRHALAKLPHAAEDMLSVFHRDIDKR